MNIYIFTIQFLNENDNIEYSIIKGVYDCKETAKEEATKALKAQKAMWTGSTIQVIGKGKVALKVKVAQSYTSFRKWQLTQQSDNHREGQPSHSTTKQR